MDRRLSRVGRRFLPLDHEVAKDLQNSLPLRVVLLCGLLFVNGFCFSEPKTPFRAEIQNCLTCWVGHGVIRLTSSPISEPSPQMGASVNSDAGSTLQAQLCGWVVVGEFGVVDVAANHLYRCNSHTVPIGNPIHGRNRPAQTDANHRFGRRFPRSIESTRNPRPRLVNRKMPSPVGRRDRHTRAWIGIASRTTTFRLRAAHSGGEDHQPAEWQRPLRTPAVARIAVPADPWPEKGASWMRDSTRGRTLGPVQGSFVENDHVIEALAPNRADDAFHVSSLVPRALPPFPNLPLAC